MSNSLIVHFNELPDPRVRGRTDYPLIEIGFCVSARLFLVLMDGKQSKILVMES